MTTFADATEPGRLLDAVHNAHRHLQEALEATTRSLEDVIKVIALSGEQSEPECEKGGVTLTRIQELIQCTQIAFIPSRRWTSLCGSMTKSVTAKFEDIAYLTLNMTTNRDATDEHVRLWEAMTNSVRCYDKVESAAWNLQAAHLVAGLRFKWNLGAESAGERHYAAVALEEPRKQGVLSVKIAPHRTRANTLDFWGPGLENTHLTASVPERNLALEHQGLGV